MVCLFVLSFFPRGVLDEILNLVESVSEGFPSYSFIGSFYRPPDENDPSYSNQVQACLSRIPIGAHVWMGGDVNLGDIDSETESVKLYANKYGICHQLLSISKDYFLDQMYWSQQRSHRGYTEHPGPVFLQQQVLG